MPHHMTTSPATATKTSAAFPRESRWHRYKWTLYVALGVLLGIYQGMNQAIGMRYHLPAWQPFVWELSSVFMVFALIPVIIRFEDRFRVDARPRLRAIGIHTGAA